MGCRRGVSGADGFAWLRGEQDQSHEQVRRMERRIADLRKKYNETHQDVTVAQKNVQKIVDGMRDLERDAVSPHDEDTPMTRHIRMLENRLDKALIKYNEAQSIRRTYEQIVKRLREERIGFDNQLGAVERTLRAKEQDLEELVLMSHDANHAKELSKADLLRVDADLQTERLHREKELQDRRNLVKEKKAQNKRIEDREKRSREAAAEASGDLNEDEEQHLRAKVAKAQIDARRVRSETELKITSYEEAFRKIKDATGISDVHEVVQKFMTQDETTIHPKHLTKQSHDKIDSVNEEKSVLKAKVEEIKYTGAGSVGFRKVIDDLEQDLKKAVQKSARIKRKYEGLARILIACKAGTQHLVDMLDVVRIDQPNVPVMDDTIVDVLAMCDYKISKSMDTISEDDSAYGGGASAGMQGSDMLSSTNVRIELNPASEYFYDENPDMHEDDDGLPVVDRAMVKSNSTLKKSKSVKKEKEAKETQEKKKDTTKARRASNAGRRSSVSGRSSAAGRAALA